jgi:pyrroloquinoline-quinone synthase
MHGDTLPAWSRAELHERLLAERRSYHLEHPFQVRMNAGQLDREQIQAWVANRFYYQINIPVKDAAILANCPDREVRKAWAPRILEQDGYGDDPGGIEAWLRLGTACGLTRDDLLSLRRVLPGVRFAVDAYVNFARTAPWQEAVCASLTELFAADAHKARLAAFPKYYPWIDPEGLQYFERRLQRVKSDVDVGLRLTLDHFTTRPLQDRALEILRFKMDVLWCLLDALHLRFLEGRNHDRTK